MMMMIYNRVSSPINYENTPILFKCNPQTNHTPPESNSNSFNNLDYNLVLFPTAVQTKHAELPGRLDAEHVQCQCPVPVLLQHAVHPIATTLLRHGRWRRLQFGLRPAAAAGLWHGKTDFWLWFWCRKSNTTGRVSSKSIESQ